MNTHDSTLEWPTLNNTIASPAQLQALGQITLVYNYLEESVGNLFSDVMPTDAAFSDKLYHKLNNRDRVDLMTAVVRQSGQDDDVKEELLYLLSCYAICTENRNILLHALLDSADADILKLAKKAARDPTREIEFHLPLADLRLVADQMADLFVHAVRLQRALNERKSAPKIHNSGLIPAPFDVEGMVVASTLPDRPTKPSPLTPYKPPS
jgi:hypothetical protein